MDTNSKPSFTKSPDTEALIRRMRKMAVDEVITYNELCAVANRASIDSTRGLIVTAMKHLLREGYVFGSIRNVGYKRLTPEDTIGKATDGRMKVSRAARRVKSTLIAVPQEKYEQMTPENKQKWNHEMALASVQALAGSRKVSDTLLRKLGTIPNSRIEIGAVLDLMKK